MYIYIHYRTLSFIYEIIYINAHIAGCNPTLPTLCVCRFESRWSKTKQCVTTNYNFNTIGLNVQTSNIYLNNILYCLESLGDPVGRYIQCIIVGV